VRNASDRKGDKGPRRGHLMSFDPQAVRAFEHAGWQQAASGDAAGFAQIEAHKVNREWRFAAAGDLIEGFRRGTVRTAALIGVQPASALPAIAAAIARGIACRGPDGFAVPIVALLASGVRP
jgi:hypothetical protein